MMNRLQMLIKMRGRPGYWLCLLSFLILSGLSAYAQQTSISGKVTDAENSPIPGVNVLVKGTTQGTITDIEGDYRLNVPENTETLVFSFVGYETQEVSISGRSTINVNLALDARQLGEVVVTALGVEREAKALGYAVQEVQGEELTQARETNLVNSLAGKVAGVQVSNSASGVGGSARVTIRGESSLNINKNQPLFVVDGVPISNEVVGSSGRGNLEVDYGNSAAEINPNDIESMTVLKGPSATALYGSRGANGVIIIKTKSGKGTRGIGVSVSSNVTFETPLVLPDWQDKYGQGNSGFFSFADGAGSGIADGVDESWGPQMDYIVQPGDTYLNIPQQVGQVLQVPQYDSPRLDANGNPIPFRGGDLNAPAGSTIQPTPWVSNPDNINNYFETGMTYTNNIALTGSNENGDFRLSVTSLNQQGIVPNTDLDRYNVSLNGSWKFSDRLSAQAVINYIKQESGNRPAISYGTESLMYLWIWYGRQLNTGNMRDYWMPGLEGTQQFNYNYNYHDNPYFTTYENINAQNKNRVYGNFSATYKFTDNLNLLVRTGTDYYNDKRPRARAFSTQRFPFGSYRQEEVTFEERNTDFLLTYDKTISQDWEFNASFGGNQLVQTQNYLDIFAPQLSIPEVYNLGNSRVQLETTQRDSEKRINSLYGLARVAYKNMLFLDVTARNDWSSTLPSNNNSYFYPSVSVSGVISDMVVLPEWFSFAKLRASYAEVGNDTDPFNLLGFYNYGTAWGNTQTVSETSTLYNSELKPESLNSYEIGMDARFFLDRLGIDVTYYNNLSRNQIFFLPITNVSGYSQRVLNAGEIKNEGLEVMLYGTPAQIGDFRWDVNINWSRNVGTVVELAEGIDAYTLTERNGAYIQAREGQPMGAMYGIGLLRVEDPNSPYFGQPINSSDGIPLHDTDLTYQGNYNPDWMAGIQNKFSYKGLNFSFLFDVREGGIVLSRTKTIGSTSGQLEETLVGRENWDPINGYNLPGNGIIAEGVKQVADGVYEPNDVSISARDWNNRYYNRGNVEVAKYDASFVKLREVKLGYTLPSGLLGNLPFRNVNISLVGRNLFLWTENPHFDPETLSMSGGTLQPGVENMAYPSTRSYGFNLSFNL
ncbi:SusC/RagA family TonB-linked outer membrane protein [Catalinimonas niigatensis]|uniref:SusC/RagA family TonB-linked outer membrane protein n=1 Tax=Catalinimonas niigatensis TaxID=1397264 RepID=UPI0026654D40|nr:SusC/RagA family TonB-linked outer membrane protein [Catalinimonas niigatensis]WPP50014.1 SusC/RagA family TonB-linked outer membrane protein [Catalinimonas niigatensis]